MEERLIWEGRPSPLEHLPTYALCGVFLWLVIPALVAVWRYLEQISTHYRVSSERITVSSGVLSKRIEETELYRVRDTRIEIPVFLRLFGLANLLIFSSDRSQAVTKLHAIPNAENLRDQLRGLVEKRRDEKGVRLQEVDF
jgi:uncharacterized membrane protein YdbT with pleckstrin-like domain